MRNPSTTDGKFTIPQLLAYLRKEYRSPDSLFMPAIQTSNATYLNIERGKRELSFLMALRICRFYNLDLHEFISLLSDEELGRNDFSIIRAKERKDKKKAAVLKARADKIKDDKSNLS